MRPRVGECWEDSTLVAFVVLASRPDDRGSWMHEALILDGPQAGSTGTIREWIDGPFERSRVMTRLA